MHIHEASAVGMIIQSAGRVNAALPVYPRLAATTGARRGEMCGLHWRNIDLDAKALHIAGAVVHVKQRLVEKDTKTHAERRMSLDDGTVAMLRDYREMLERAMAL